MTTYRLFGHGVRLHYPPGRPEVRVMRPYDREHNVYLDSDEAPTLVEITGEEILFDLDFALRTGALVPYTPPEPAAEGEAVAGRQSKTRGVGEGVQMETPIVVRESDGSETEIRLPPAVQAPQKRRRR